MHQPQRIDAGFFAVGFGVLVTLYFWWSNIKGIHESSGQALRIMQITTVMLGILLIWCPLTMLIRGNATLPPPPIPSNLHFTNESLGWFRGTVYPTIPFIALTIAFGHSLLSMSGFETLAQVYREIAYPKLKNLKITANIVCGYAVVCTGVITMMAAMIIPENIRDMATPAGKEYVDNLIGVLAMNLSGPYVLRLGFRIFVVLVGVLILSGAVNTSIIGANGVLNRVAEDNVLLPWFRRLHRRFGTTYRIINIVVLLQLITIVISRGDVGLLGEAYAFGVVWSFFLKSLGVLALRYQRHDQEYKFPFNLKLPSGRELPVGLLVTTLILGLVATANLFSKEIATKSGVAFTVTLFIIFSISDRISKRQMKGQKSHLEEFNLDHQPQVDSQVVKTRPGSVLVAVRDYRNMEHLRKVLQKTNLRRNDIIVMTVRQISAGAGEYDLADEQIFSEYEKELFTHVVQVAEKEGKPVELLVVPAVNPFDALVQTAANLKVSRLVTGVSAKMASEELARQIGWAWERLPEPRHPFSLEVIAPGRQSAFVNLGPHPPRLWPEDVERAHELWLNLSGELGSRLHHRDVVGVALRRLASDLNGEGRSKVVLEIEQSLRHEEPPGPAATP
ncbi:MAG TPA: APC family permease, partial [Bryobacteraceae bacterium]